MDANAERNEARFKCLLPEWLTRSDQFEVPEWRVLGANPA